MQVWSYFSSERMLVNSTLEVEEPFYLFKRGRVKETIEKQMKNISIVFLVDSWLAKS